MWLSVVWTYFFNIHNVNAFTQLIKRTRDDRYRDKEEDSENSQDQIVPDTRAQNPQLPMRRERFQLNGIHAHVDHGDDEHHNNTNSIDMDPFSRKKRLVQRKRLTRIVFIFLNFKLIFFYLTAANACPISCKIVDTTNVNEQYPISLKGILIPGI